MSPSPKRLKKSDMSTPWMRERLDRKVVTIQPERHLIVCEGEKTEPNYFDGLKREINAKYPREKIRLEIKGEGKNTLSLLEQAETYVKREQIKRISNVPNHVWLVYDKDSFDDDDFDNAKQRCDSLTHQGEVEYHALWSNQCIELWFLLHFGYYQADLHRSGYSPKLNRHLAAIGAGKYAKNRDDIYSILRPYLPDATRNARALKEKHNSPVPSKNAPGTSVFEIFEFLSDYLDDPKP